MAEFLSGSLFFGVALTAGAYLLALALKGRAPRLFLNPLLTATVCVIAALRLLGVEYAAYNATAKALTDLLTPATVALAVPIYEKRTLLLREFPAVMGGLLAGALSGLTGVLLVSKLFGVSHQVYVSFLPKSITTAIGLGVAEELGGIDTLTVAVIVLTGIFGGVTGEWVLERLRVKDDLARGLALGAAAHTVGAARALELGETEGAMAGLAIAGSGLLVAGLAPLFAGLM